MDCCVFYVMAVVTLAGPLWTPSTKLTFKLDQQEIQVFKCLIQLLDHFLDPGDCGSTAVKALCYKSDGCWFDPGFFSDIKSFQSHYGPGVDSASNGNEYQGYFLGVKAVGM